MGRRLRAACARMTIREAVDEAAAVLARASLDSPRLEAELLLEHVLETPRLRLVLQGGNAVDEAPLGRFRELVSRRAQRIPLQHLVGWAPFLEHRVECTRDALVPRPETEHLALLAIAHLRGMPPCPAPRVLDIGTGTGCLALAIAAALPHVAVTAVEKSHPAAELARRNFRRTGVAGRVGLVEGDAFGVVPALGGRFDLVVTNPPYIPTADIGQLDPEVRDHDPAAALDGGADGLDFYRRLALEGRNWAAPGGVLMAEFGDGQARALESLFSAAGWIAIRVEKDLSRRERILIVQAPPGNRA